MQKSTWANVERAVPSEGGLDHVHGVSPLGCLCPIILLVPAPDLTQGPSWEVHASLIPSLD